MRIKTRTIYSDDFTEEVWGYRINQIVGMIKHLELLSVKEGLRDASYDIVDYEQLKHYQEEYPELKFIFHTKTSKTEGYSIASKPLKEGDDYSLRVLVVRSEDTTNYLKKLKENGDDYLGKILGYPKCCRDSFDENWNKKHMIDYTFNQAKNTEGAEVDENTITLPNSIPDGANGMIRWLGIRARFHMPCSFSCEESVNKYEQLKELALEYGYHKEIKWMEQAFNWEITWSNLHGIAILTTPVSKLRFSANYTADEKKVTKEGSTYTGICKRWLWKENGFSSYKAMENMHRSIEDLVYDINPDSIADLGCGNGYLLSKFDAEPYGIDCNAEVIRRAVEGVLPEYRNNFEVGDLSDFSFNENYDVVIMSAGRLIEMDEKTKKEFVGKLIEHSDEIILSAYSDWLDMYGNFENLIEKTGFEIKEKVEYSQNASALVRWK